MPAGRLDWPVIGTVHVERPMNARPVVVGEVIGEKSSEMPFVEDDNEVETLAADGADDASDVGRLPG